jgi:hypothetical protein
VGSSLKEKISGKEIEKFRDIKGIFSFSQSRVKNKTEYEVLDILNNKKFCQITH